jgi:predicted RND superfamily exporter protein
MTRAHDDMSIRGRIELGFEAWGHWVVRWRWPVVGLMLVLTLGLGSFLPQLRVDNSEEAFLLADDPERIRYDRFREQFDRDDRVVVVVHPPAIFDLAFLTTLRSLHEDILQEVPYVEVVTSLINARDTRGNGDELIVGELL